MKTPAGFDNALTAYNDRKGNAQPIWSLGLNSILPSDFPNALVMLAFDDALDKVATNARVRSRNRLEELVITSQPRRQDARRDTHTLTPSANFRISMSMLTVTLALNTSLNTVRVDVSRGNLAVPEQCLRLGVSWNYEIGRAYYGIHGCH